MSWTYSGDPSLSVRDQVRFLLGDTVEARAQFSDEEIDWLVSENPNPYLAAASGADYAVSKMVTSSASAGVKTKTVGALSISYDDAERAKEFRSLAARLRLRAALSRTIVPYSGGISKSDKETMTQDTDWNQPAFRIGMHDYPGTSSITGSTE